MGAQVVTIEGTRKLAILSAGPVVALVVVAAVAPLAVVLGASRLVIAAVLATGAWVSIRRLGSVDLGTAASVLAGASAGGIAPALLGVPVALGVVPAAVAGGLVSAVVVAVGARVGRAPSSLTSLAVVIAGVASGSAWGAAGGRAGFHAVPLLTGTDRGDLIVALVVLASVVTAVGRWARGRPAAAASVAVRAAHVAASLGHRPVLAAARGGAVAGAVLGIGGWLQATSSGSVIPAGHGLELSASLALAALVGGGSVMSGTVGALAVFGPAVIWPTAPVLGAAPVLVVGALGLILLAMRPGGILTARAAQEPERDTPRRTALGPPRPVGLHVDATPLPAGEVTFEVDPGEVVAVVGPNGSGKSTLLARVGGQLPDHGAVRFDGEPAPEGAVARARQGFARTWQHPPDVHGADGVRAAIRDGQDVRAAATARDMLGEHADTPAGRDLVRLVARRPAIAALDEPGASLPPRVVAELIRALASAGTTVVVAEHRPELVDVADRRVTLERPGVVVEEHELSVPEVRGGGRELAVHLDGTRVHVAPGDAVVMDEPMGERIVAAVLGRAPASSLEVRLGGRRLPSGHPPSVVRRGLGIVTDVPPPSDVTVRDHLAAVGGTAAADRLLRDAPLLVGRGADRAGVLSGGERRMLSWLVCLARQPDAVLLDRSTAGLDTDARRWATDIVASWRSAGVPVLIRQGRPEERRWARPAAYPGQPYG